MDKISIDNLFPKAKCGNRPLDVYSLYNPRENKRRDEIAFSIENLKSVREEKKKKIYEEYKKLFDRCLRKITEINKKNSTYLIYDIPPAIFGQSNYNPVECLEFIEIRLKKLNIDAMILSNVRIYISWANI